MALLGGPAAETLAVGVGLPLARAIPGIGPMPGALFPRIAPDTHWLSRAG